MTAADEQTRPAKPACPMPAHRAVVGVAALVLALLAAMAPGSAAVVADRVTVADRGSQLSSSTQQERGKAPGRTQRVRITVVSNRADLISGGDALVRVSVPSGRSGTLNRIRLNGRDVTRRFAAGTDGHYLGLVSGLRVGRNTFSAALRDGRASRITIRNRSSSGPVISGRQVRPWTCNPGARNEQCRREPRYTFYYVPTGVDPDDIPGMIGAGVGSDGYFLPYDPSEPPPSALIATTTTDQGKTVPFIVRLETGSVNRGQYQIAVLYDPDRRWSAARPQRAWNRKLFLVGGPNCGVIYQEGTAPGVLLAKVLGRGFATASHALAATGNNCSLVTQAESLMMTKERLIEQYGPVRYTMSIGGSGASIVQQWIANAYPGIYDGLIVEASFPDAWTELINTHDCIGLLDYWNNPTSWAPGVAWGPAEQSAVANGDAPSSCVTFATAFKGLFTPADETGQLPARATYDPKTRPRGIRGTIWDYSVAQFGRRSWPAWGPAERAAGRGFANRPLDTVGIQYGLNALLDGEISPAQFVDMNTKVGGRDIDYEVQPGRTTADPVALATAYRSGYLNQANNLDIPVIDIRGASNNELHDTFHSWSMRARLNRANGHHRNQVIWNSFTASGFIVDPALEAQAFRVMNTWLDRIHRDRSRRSQAEKVAVHKPSAAVDRCTVTGTGQPGPCLVPESGTPRLGAGQPLVDDVAKCQLKPLHRLDFFPVLFTDGQWDDLQDAFPAGVCDYQKPAVRQRPTIAWLTYRDGPRGRPLGAPPVSRPVHREQ